MSDTNETALEAFHQDRATIRADMGGPARQAAVHADGKLTARERIERFVDPGSFDEVGTFARSEDPAQRPSTPGDGTIAGHAMLRGKPIAVAADDITVKRASSSVISQRRSHRVYEQALAAGHPFVYFAERGGARLPDSLGSEGFAKVGGSAPELARRQRRIPHVTAVLGDSFGGSSITAMQSDLRLQLDGTCMAMTSPRVIEIATGEKIGWDELGGSQLHATQTGMVDHVVADEASAFALAADFLDLLPPNAWTPPRIEPLEHPASADAELAALVPTSRRRTYDMQRVLARLTDDGAIFELAPKIGRGLITGLARLGGQTVGIIASQPRFEAGVLTPAACDKAIRLLCTCDAFGLPVVFLIDTPGFIVGKDVEHEGLVPRAVMFQQALALTQVPKLTVVIRKAFGLAFFSLAGSPESADLVCAWPGSEIGFMDPIVGANVLWSDELEHLDAAARTAELQRRAADLAAATDPYGPAAIMRVDEVIDPAETRMVLTRALARFAGRPFSPGWQRPLASWPTTW
ncbi:MAG: acyl-CoA carboxylase subunit beta [Desertimonas sp.]